MLRFVACHFIVYTKYRIDINHLYKFFIKLHLLFSKYAQIKGRLSLYAQYLVIFAV